jgi:transposase-like protein
MELEVLDGAAQEVSKEFKLEPVNMVLVRGVPISQATKDPDINENVLSRWIREFRQSEQQGFLGHGV